MVLSLTQIVCIILACASTYFGVKWCFRVDTAIENRRRKAIELSARLTAMGFKSMSEIFMDYAVGDYSGMFSKVSMVVERLRGNDKDILADLSDVFDNLLSIKLACQEGRTMVRSELESVEKMLAPVAPVAPVAPAAPVAPVAAVAAVAPVVAPVVAPAAPVEAAPAAPVAPAALAPQVILVPIQPAPVVKVK